MTKINGIIAAIVSAFAAAIRPATFGRFFLEARA
jgi:hypothetical protein